MTRLLCIGTAALCLAGCEAIATYHGAPRDSQPGWRDRSADRAQDSRPTDTDGGRDSTSDAPQVCDGGCHVISYTITTSVACGTNAANDCVGQVSLFAYDNEKVVGAACHASPTTLSGGAAVYGNLRVLYQVKSVVLKAEQHETLGTCEIKGPTSGNLYLTKPLTVVLPPKQDVVLNLDARYP